MRDFLVRLRCFLRRHPQAKYGLLFGWCPQCEHTIHTGDKYTLYRGCFYAFPPKKHD